MFINIAIDGPAGAGKSTIAKLLAKELGYVYIDTGAMYRAVAYKVLNSNICTSNVHKIVELLNTIEINISYNELGQRLWLNGVDISSEIRNSEISKAASKVATIQEVRVKLVELQRNLAKKSNVVMDGRDIGTFVLPDANLKIFLTASIDERAKRRYSDIDGIQDLNEIKEEIRIRDYNDEHRKISPLRKAKDAILIDTTEMNIEEVVYKISDLVKKYV